MDRGTIWRSICAEAWRKTVADLRVTGGGTLMISVILFAIYAVFVWYIVGEQHALAEVRDRLLLIAAPLAIFPLWWGGRMALTIPEREVRTAKRIEMLHTFLRPRLDFELVDDCKPVRFAFGNHLTGHTGRIQTVIRAWEDVICGVVRNRSPKDAPMAEARITELVGNNGKSIRDPVPLLWAAVEGKPRDSATIPALGTRTLLLFRVVNGGVYFVLGNPSPEYAHFFEGGTTFTGKLAVEELYYGSLLVHFTLELTGEPTLKIVHSNTTPRKTSEEWEQELANLEGW